MVSKISPGLAKCIWYKCLIKFWKWTNCSPWHHLQAVVNKQFNMIDAYHTLLYPIVWLIRPGMGCGWIVNKKFKHKQLGVGTAFLVVNFLWTRTHVNRINTAFLLSNNWCYALIATTFIELQRVFKEQNMLPKAKIDNQTKQITWGTIN